MTAIVRSHLEAVVGAQEPEQISHPLLSYSKGELSRDDAIQELGLRDHSELLIALGNAELPPPQSPQHEIENQAALLERLWRSS